MRAARWRDSKVILTGETCCRLIMSEMAVWSRDSHSGCLMMKGPSPDAQRLKDFLNMSIWALMLLIDIKCFFVHCCNSSSIAGVFEAQMLDVSSTLQNVFGCLKRQNDVISWAFTSCHWLHHVEHTGNLGYLHIYKSHVLFLVFFFFSLLFVYLIHT